MKRTTAVIVILAVLGLAAILAAFLYATQSGTGTPKDLTMKLETDKETYHVNDTVLVRLLAYNPTATPISLGFRTSQKFSGAIELSNGSYSKVIYNSSENSYLQVIRGETIAPFGSLGLASCTFAATLEPGAYQIKSVGSVTGYNEFAINRAKQILVIAGSP
jgi:hypothetical protein